MECVTFLDPEQHRRKANTVLLTILRFEGRLMFVDLQTLVRAAKVPVAFDILPLKSFSDFPSLAILLPRYTNSSTLSEALLLMVTGSSFLPLILMGLVLVMLMLRPPWLSCLEGVETTIVCRNKSSKIKFLNVKQ